MAELALGTLGVQKEMLKCLGQMVELLGGDIEVPGGGGGSGLTDAQLRATPVPVSVGEIEVKNDSGNPLTVVDPRMEYEFVAAGATNEPLGAAGAIGDYLNHFVIQPATTGAGTVALKDGGTTVFTFTGGGALSDLSPRTIAWGAKSKNGGWTITTGANVAVTAIGDFT